MQATIVLRRIFRKAALDRLSSFAISSPTALASAHGSKRTFGTCFFIPSPDPILYMKTQCCEQEEERRIANACMHDALTDESADPTLACSHQSLSHSGWGRAHVPLKWQNFGPARRGMEAWPEPWQPCFVRSFPIDQINLSKAQAQKFGTLLDL